MSLQAEQPNIMNAGYAQESVRLLKTQLLLGADDEVLA